MDVTKIDFSKVEGIVDARYVIPSPEQLTENIKKGFISAFTEESFNALADAWLDYNLSKE